VDHNERKAADKVVETVTDGWVLALAAFFGLLAGFGLGLPVIVALLAGVGTVVAAAAVNAVPVLIRGSKRDAIGGGAERAELMPRTEQAQIVGQLEATLRRIRDLRDGPTVADSVKDSAAQAFAAATSALDTANAVAVGVDQLDAALRELQTVRVAGPSQQRLAERRGVMLDRLNRTLAGVLDVYSKLVETNATVNTSSIVEAGDQAQLQQIGSSLDDLRLIVGELEKDTGHELPPLSQ
jgi:hypothetical protein